jgi:hypothetical protein
MAEAWSISGDYFEACNCATACPCVFLGDPTQGHCTVVVAWHIKEGKSGPESLAGLNFALACYTPGNMMKTKWDVAVYIDERATPSQKERLVRIISGQAGGLFGAIGPLIGKVLGVKSARMDFRVEGKKRSLTIPGIAEIRSEALAGPGGDTQLTNPSFGITPSVTVGRSSKLSLKDYGWDWNLSGGNSFMSPFKNEGP